MKHATFRKSSSSFNMTPMIDVTLQLIIFFLYTSQFTQAIRSPVDLPEQAGDTAVESRPGAVVVDMRADGSIVVDNNPLSLDQFVAQVTREAERSRKDGEELEVLIRADRHATGAHLNRIADALANAGVRSWRIGTLTPRGGG